MSHRSHRLLPDQVISGMELRRQKLCERKKREVKGLAKLYAGYLPQIMALVINTYIGSTVIPSEDLASWS